MNRQQELEKIIANAQKELDELKKCSFVRGQVVLVCDNEGDERVVRVFSGIAANNRYRFRTFDAGEEEEGYATWAYCEAHPDFPPFVWCDHDGSDVCPVDRMAYVTALCADGLEGTKLADYIDWKRVTRYIVLPPVDGK